MKRQILFITLLLPFLGYSQVYEIANWYNFKKGAVSLTFDDGTLDQRTNAIPTLTSRGIPGTFFINQSANYSWAINAIANGHEIGNHTQNHVHLPIIDTNQFSTQISGFQKTLNTALGAPILTLAYPYGEGGEIDSTMHYIQDSVATSHIGARSVTQPINDSAYRYDFYHHDRAYYQANTIHMSNNMNGYDSTFQKVVEYGGMMTYMFHAVGNPGGFDNIDVAKFEDFLDTLSAYENDIWVCTFRDALMYHREKKTATLQTVSAPFMNGDTWVLNLSDGLSNSIYNQPLTIRIAIPDTITGILGAKQNNTTIPFRIINDSVIVNIIPDGGDLHFDVVDCVQPEVDNLTSTGPMNFCTPDSIVIEATHHPNYEYAWFNNDQPHGSDTNRIVVKESGVFHAFVTLNDCPAYTDSISVVVTGICGVPEVDFTASTTKEFLDQEISFLSTSTNLEGNETYYWDFGDGASLNPGFYGLGPIMVSYSTAGLKTAKLTVNGSVGSDSTEKFDIIEILNNDGCGIYKEDFNNVSDLSFVGCWCDYNAEIVNDAFRITTRDTVVNQWYSVWWEITNSDQDSTYASPIDFSDPLFKPVLRIRAKASDTARLAFSLMDTSLTSTAGSVLNQISYIDVTTEYQTFEIDFSGLFYYQWNQFEPVDSTHIALVQMTINEGFESFPFTNRFGQYVNEQFVGTVDIDWISIGEKCEFDSLIANIVLPNTVCTDQEFTVWNHSEPMLENAEYDWSFDSVGTSFDVLAMDESPITLSYSEPGLKAISLEVTTDEGDIVTVVEHVMVSGCGVGLDEYSNQLSTSILNPFSKEILGTINSQIATEGSIVLSDMNGKTILIDRLQLHPGSNDISYDNLDLPKGVYFLTVYTTTGQNQVKLVSTGH